MQSTHQDPGRGAWPRGLRAGLAWTIAVFVIAFGETVDHSVARLASTPGLVGLATQACFAAIPWAQRSLSR